MYETEKETVKKLLEESIAIYTPHMNTDYNMSSIAYPYIKKTSMR